jgi:hypothetical protein
MPAHFSPSRRLAALALVCAVTLGCQRTARDLSLDPEQARAACTTFLDAWKDGKQPDELQPGITGADFEWASGHKLVSYEVQPEEFNDGTNLHINVQLTLQDKEGKESSSNALYIVGTSPVVTVFRK